MDAKELASMVNGWPEAARPMMDCGWADSVGTAAYSEGACSLEEAELIDADHACMSGLRWLLEVKRIAVRLYPPDKNDRDLHPHYPWHMELRHNRGDGGWDRFEYQSLLHAIDAAIRAVEGEKK